MTPIRTSPLLSSDAVLEQVSGIVKRVTFHSVESGWTVLKISPFNDPAKEITVTIHQSKVFAGATMDFFGNWNVHPKYGNQFKAIKAVEKKPATANALEKYLGSGLIKGVGPKTAKRIVSYFGKDTLDVFDTSIDRLKEVTGIAELKLEMIKKGWIEHKEIREVMMFLQSYGISTLFAVKIYKSYGNDAIKIVSENPYKLAKDIYGIGFYSADQIALSMEIPKDSPKRITAGIDHVLDSSREEGHCYLTREQIIKGVDKLLQLECEEKTNELLELMEKNEDLKVRNLNETKCYYSKSLYYDEMYIAGKVNTLSKHHIIVDLERVDSWIKSFCEKTNTALSDEQAEAVKGIVTNGFSILTGGPGCGKTTTTRVLVKLLKAMGKKVVLCAPTGRASQRMSEVIGDQSKTIHRLLEWAPATGGFKKNEEDQLKADFLIADECSMLDIHLSASLLHAIHTNTQVLFIGDADQLPSVGAGNVFKDIIASKKVTTFHLTKIFRQAQESLIITYAHQINHGETPHIESPFYKPDLWLAKTDCLFVDSDEATQDQLHFIRRVKQYSTPPSSVMYSGPTLDPNLYTEDGEVPLPDKYKHVDLERLFVADSRAKELKEVLKKTHPWSSLHYGLTASDMIKRIYSETIPKYFGNNTEVQILSPMTRGSLGTHQLNIEIQKTVNPARVGLAQLQLGDRIFRVGDRVIQKRNNYDLEVFNGDIGKIAEVDNEEIRITVAYISGQEKRLVVYERDDISEIELAYAITIHKSQGSEFPAVIMPLFNQHFSMLFRNLIYTGLTRAKKLAVIVGNRRALTIAVKNNKMLIRQTALQYLLQTGANEQDAISRPRLL
ncbi:MAG: AAA family ATPase [Candidatus Roizmanbacteria bacterium]